MTTRLATPARTAGEKVQEAVDERASTDDILHFWTAFGWTVLTCGLYAFYVFYLLMRRARDHHRRRVTLLLAAQDHAWEDALAAAVGGTAPIARRDVPPAPGDAQFGRG